MRGGAQTHLLSASDGHHYVVKTRNNPQGHRILINEYLAWRILEHLKIPTQPANLIEVSPAFIEATNSISPRFGATLGRAFTPAEPGWHYGSRYPGPPNLTLVHDFIAEDSLALCRNLQHFIAILLFDKWTGNTDARQSIFFRTRLADFAPDPDTLDPNHRGLIASFIDQGFCFNGPYWDFSDRYAAGLYPMRRVYQRVRGWQDFEPWLERIKTFPDDLLDRALREMPQAWFTDQDWNDIPRLCETLLRRRPRVSRLIEEVKDKLPDVFPSWS
jgi:hypothetical protein